MAGSIRDTLLIFVDVLRAVFRAYGTHIERVDATVEATKRLKGYKAVAPVAKQVTSGRSMDGWSSHPGPACVRLGLFESIFE